MESYEEAQLLALKTGLLAAGFIVIGGFFATAGLPRQRFSELGALEAAAPRAAPASQ